MAKIDIEQLPGESKEEYRRRYHRAWERANRIAKGLPVREPSGMCVQDGCDKPASAKGLCRTHYAAKWKAARSERDDLRPQKQDHPLYVCWYDRYCRDSLCKEWRDFEMFCEGVGERPSEDHFLHRRVPHEPYGPSNFVWKLHLRRREGEALKDFHARKYRSQKENHPRLVRRRHLARHFGIDEAIYDQMLTAQGGVCFICGQPENGRSLAVDHVHDETQIVRDLLCYMCNSAFGAVRESIPTLRNMIAYAERWADPVAKAKELGRPRRINPRQHEIVIETQWGPMILSEAARRAGLRPATVLSRARMGWPEEKLLEPLKRPGYRAKSKGNNPFDE